MRSRRNFLKAVVASACLRLMPLYHPIAERTPVGVQYLEECRWEFRDLPCGYRITVTARITEE